MLGNMLANSFIDASKSPVFDDPGNYSLDYENVKFKAKDGVELSGWLIKGEQDKVIIQSHFGLQCSRSGYTPKGKGLTKGSDKDINFLRQAKYLYEAGYSVLMYDFRNHGNSSSGTLPWSTWGLEEAKDVIAAVDYISHHPDYQNASIGLLSICMGQGACVNAFAMENGLKQYSNLKAMISLQPIDYHFLVDAMGLPKFLINSTTKSIKKRTGWDYNTITWRDHVKEVKVPTLLIQNKNDGFLNEQFINAVYESLNVEKEMLWISVQKKKTALRNRLACYDWLGSHPEPIVGWFDKHII